MPYLSAHLLDRCNEWLVHYRLGGRQRPATGEGMGQALVELAAAGHPSPAAIGRLHPEPAGGDLWQARSPWPRVEGANARWWAARVAPAGSRAPAAVGADNGGRPPALILLHGWLMDRPQELLYRSWARRAARHGIEVWMPRLPFHRERAGPGEISGERCLSADLTTTFGAVTQAVVETRLLATWLRDRGAPRVGLWGMSLGGWVGALAATLDDDWDALALWAPVAEPTAVLWESRLVDGMRAAIVAGGINAADLDSEAFDALTPARRDPLVPRQRTLLVGAIHDQVVAPASIRRLARRWHVDVRWVPHGHISLMLSRASVADTVAFLAAALGEPVR
jgi:dienelactone hydrolase